MVRFQEILPLPLPHIYTCNAPPLLSLQPVVVAQVHERLRLDHPHRGILAELLRGLGVREYEQEADLLLDAFGSIR